MHAFLRVFLRVAFVVVATYGYTDHLSNVIARTQYGSLRGLRTMLDTDLPSVDGYLGIEYASATGPAGRFMPPSGPKDNWKGIRTASEFRPVCPQAPINQSVDMKSLPRGRVEHLQRLSSFVVKQAEDCLYLNLYVPVAAAPSNSSLPVIVFVHGDSYDFGTGNAYDGHALASFGKVIVVTLNYRLGAFGFLSMMSNHARGNMALWDVAAALHWLKHNVRAFGGDPSLVTLLGHGCGAALVHLLISSGKLVSGGSSLFSRAILQSGTAGASWSMTQNPLHFSRKLAELVDCHQHWGSSEHVLNCLRRVQFRDLSLARTQIVAPRYLSAFAPVVDGMLVSQQPQDTRHGSKSRIPLLLGVVKNEGFLYLTRSQIKQGISEETRDRVLRTMIRTLYKWHRQRIYETLRFQYKTWDTAKETDTQRRDRLMELLGDLQYNVNVFQLAKAHATRADTFAYVFNYPTLLEAYPRWAGGVHGDELPYIFGAPITGGAGRTVFSKTFTRPEDLLSRTLIRYWSNFATSGNPNRPTPLESSLQHIKNQYSDITWRPFTSDQQDYLHINVRPSMKQRYRAEELGLWTDLIEKIHHSGLNHHLDDANNSSRFESSISQPPPLPPPPLPPPPPPGVTSLPSLLPPTTVSVSGPNSVDTTSASSGPLQTYKPELPPIPEPLPEEAAAATEVVAMTNSSDPRVGFSSFIDSKLSLSLTVAVGCSLLFLNILIFAGVYYQKDRMRAELKQQRRNSDNGNGAQDDTPPEEAELTPSAQMSSRVANSRLPIPVAPPHAPSRYHQPPLSSRENCQIGKYHTIQGPKQFQTSMERHYDGRASMGRHYRSHSDINGQRGSNPVTVV